MFYHIEILISKILNLLKIYKNSKPIPRGPYCYTIDESQNKIKPLTEGYWIKTCKYYRCMKKELYAGCTYVGFIGWDLCLGDSCKICDENKDY